ncbi:MAG: hypothetical protein ACRC5H_01580 [Treponemataceae bacterium]
MNKIRLKGIMALHENNDFGKKIFFIYPPQNFVDKVVPSLLEDEFEIYFIDNYRYAKNILRLHPNSICFIYIDVIMQPESWFNFLSSFQNDEILSTIFLGILSSKRHVEVREYFLLNAIIPAGFVIINQNMDAVTEQIKKIVIINGAKGRRKFVRAQCDDDLLVSIDCDINNQLHSFPIHDISSIGLSIQVHSTQATLFQPNMLLREATLHLRAKTYHCNAIVLLSEQREEMNIIVLVFTRGLSLVAKIGIREYIQAHLQKKINEQIANMPLDDQNYSAKSFSEKNNTAFLVPLDDPTET